MPSKRSSKRSQKKSARSNAVFNPRVELSDRPAYRGQQVYRAMLFGTSGILPTTVGTGVINNALGVNTSDITGFATRFGSTFDEYRILGVDCQIRCAAASSGVSFFWFDEKSNASATVNECYERVTLNLPNTNANAKSTAVLKWRARDLLDLQYTAIGTVATPVYFKIYTDTANFGAPASVTNLWYVQFRFMVEFRGLKST
jgi:hypothetical protein